MPTICPQCAERNADNASHCWQCSAALTQEEPQPLVRTWLLGLFATVLICAIGAAALAYVHQTATPLGERRAAGEPSLSRDRAFLREQAETAEAPAPDQPPADLRDAEPVGAASAASNTVSDEMRQIESGSVGLAPGENPLDGTGIVLMPSADSSQPTLSWSPSVQPPTRVIQATPEPLPPVAGVAPLPAETVSGTAPAPDSNPSTGFAPEPVAPSAAGISANAPTGIAQEAAEVQTVAPDLALGNVGRQPDVPTSLAEAQRVACAAESFLSGFVCRESVRLDFCAQQWNRHPDCAIQRQEPSL